MHKLVNVTFENPSNTNRTAMDFHSKNRDFSYCLSHRYLRWHQFITEVHSLQGAASVAILRFNQHLLGIYSLSSY